MSDMQTGSMAVGRFEHCSSVLWVHQVWHVMLFERKLEEKNGFGNVGDFDVWREFWDLESATRGSPD